MLFDKALAAFNEGDMKAAARAAKKLVKAAPEAADAWQLSGMIALETGQPGAAVKSLRQGLRRVPESPGLNDLLGVALTETGEPEAAIEHHQRALRLAPDDPGTLNNLGNALRHAGRFEDSRQAYEDSLRLRPGHLDTLFNLGNVLIELDAFPEAEAVLQDALRRMPGEPEVLRNLGAVYMKLRKTEQAQACYQEIIDQGAADHGVYNNLAMSRLTQGDVAAARELLARALSMAPDDSQALVNASIVHFLEERWPEAWTAYEARWQWDTFPPRPFPQAPWQGQDLNGKTILAWGEQGLGDEIMFASMVPDLIAAGAQVIVECDPRLQPVFSRSFETAICVARSDPPAAETNVDGIDFQVATGNLGRWLRTCEADFKGGAPFLRADRQRAQALRERYLGGADDLLVGITWNSRNADIGDVKSVSLDVLRPLLEVPGVRFLDLQYGDTEAERAEFATATGIQLIHDDEIDSMVDMDGHMAQIAAVDLVISISNTTAHAAGALGVPLWALLQKIGDRRWLVDRDDSPWYGCARLFRQNAIGEWDGAVAEVAAALAEFRKQR